MKWEWKQKYLFKMRGWAGPAPCPLPLAPLAELLGGGGRDGGPGLAWGFWAGKGGFSWSMKQASFKAKLREVKEKKRNVQSVDL